MTKVPAGSWIIGGQSSQSFDVPAAAAAAFEALALIKIKAARIVDKLVTRDQVGPEFGLFAAVNSSANRPVRGSMHAPGHRARKQSAISALRSH